MIGLDYTHVARYLVDDQNNKTIGRFNSLKKAKALTKDMKEWTIYDTDIVAGIKSDDKVRCLNNFDKTLYPHMHKCAKLLRRYKKTGVS